MTTATTATSLAPSHAISWDPEARVPDWVVLGRIRDLIVADLPVPDDIFGSDSIVDYIPALLAAGHKHHEIERATGVKPSRHLPRRTR
ncbi:hypothetical protein [Dietzia cercidiphylli]|uniref:Uncharacterized protein n=1 Tax=Dietzia cercidiphylli TaxID=498199 RepID=A0ABP4VEG6_9ACTN|nr:hypothetical protein [Dietzia cercidiphylli]MBB1046430.1 hypothetical protein [Dietzia cercidiphylli]